MAFQGFYTPTKANPFVQVKNTDINVNLIAIQNAFNALTQLQQTSSSFSFGDSGSRSVAIDLRSASASSFYVTVNLPISPNVDDPPVTISISNEGARTPGVLASAALIQTADGNLVMGVDPTASPLGAPYLSNSGDTISLLFVGGSIGWLISDYKAGAFVNNVGADTTGWNALSLLVGTVGLFPGLDCLIDTSGFVGVASSPLVLGVTGCSASITKANAGGNNINVGTFAQTFNGGVGPFIIALNAIKYTFITMDFTGNVFEVVTS